MDTQDQTIISSIMHTLFPVTLLTSSSKPLHESHRLVEITFKTPQDKKNDPNYKRHASRCVSVPKQPLTIQPDCIKAALQDCYEELQDKTIRSIIVNHLESPTLDFTSTEKPLQITAEQISLEAVAAFHARTSTGSGKLSGAMLEDWYNSNLAELLAVTVQDKLGFTTAEGQELTTDQQGKINQATKQIKALIVKLAAPAPLPPAVAKQVKFAVSLADDDKIKSTLLAKLEAYIQAPQEDLLVNLGG